MEYLNKEEVKRLIFNIFDNTRLLFNDFYNGKENYNYKDIKIIKGCLTDTKIMIEELQEELKEML